MMKLPKPTLAPQMDMPPGNWTFIPEYRGTVYVRSRTFGNKIGPKNISGRYICDVPDAIEVGKAYVNENEDVFAIGRNKKTGEQVTAISKKAPPGKISYFQYYE